jgi:hypothetical protein
MLREALALMAIRPKIDSTEDNYGYCSGYRFKDNFGEYWVGIQYDWPEILLFVTLHEIDEDAYEQLELGRIAEGQWIYELNLSANETEEMQFYRLSKSRQLQRIERFLKDSLDAVSKISLAYS